MQRVGTALLYMALVALTDAFVTPVACRNQKTELMLMDFFHPKNELEIGRRQLLVSVVSQVVLAGFASFKIDASEKKTDARQRLADLRRRDDQIFQLRLKDKLTPQQENLLVELQCAKIQEALKETKGSTRLNSLERELEFHKGRSDSLTCLHYRTYDYTIVYSHWCFRFE